MELKGLKVLVTGGTSGLGLALVNELSARGASVATFSRRNVTRSVSRNVRSFQADISSKDDVHFIAAQTFASLGDVDILINCASSLGPVPLRSLMDTECENFEDVFQTNIVGPFRLIKLIAPSMITRRKGLIINISSDAAISGYANWGSYSSSKAALDQLTKVLNAELGEFGVRSVSIDPGDMRTPMHFAAIPDADPNSLKDPALSARQIADWIASGTDSGERFKL